MADSGEQRSALEGERRLQVDLQVLLADYDATKDDERTFIALSASLASVGVAVLGGLAAIVSRSCEVVHTGSCFAIPRWAFVLLPLAPYAFGAYQVIQASWSSMRNLYLRELEREIHRRLEAVRPNDPVLPFPSFVHLSGPLIDTSRGLRSYRVVWTTIYVAYFTLIGAFTVLCAWLSATTWLLRIPGFLVYSALALAIFRVSFYAVDPRPLWRIAVRRLPEGLRQTLTDRRDPADEGGVGEREDPTGDRTETGPAG